MAQSRPNPERDSSRLTLTKAILASAIVLILIWAGVKGWRVYSFARAMQLRSEEAQKMLADGITEVDPDSLERLALAFSQDAAGLKSELDIILPFTPYLGWIPRYGPTIEAARPLLVMLQAVTEAAAYVARGLGPGLSAFQEGLAENESPLPLLVAAIGDARPELQSAGELMERVAAAREEIGDTSRLAWRARTALEQVDSLMPLALDSLKLAPVLPSLMGMDGTRRYLIIAQNEDEIRPTGGFISGAGILTLEKGHISDLAFLDAYDVDDWQNKPYGFPPQPLYDLMGLELFLFRDANFWPDFPTSAEKAMDLYSYGRGGQPLDGAIAVDQQFMQYLLSGTGPVRVEETGLLINSDEVIDEFRQAWAFQGDPGSDDWLEWYENRKAFIGTFASAVRNRIESQFGEIDPQRLAQNLFEALEGKHMQVYVREQQAAAVLDAVDWDGRLDPARAADQLMIVDANLGYNKANIHIERTATYEVSLNSAGGGEAVLIIDYQHDGLATGEPCVQDFSYAFDVVSDYLNIADKCYWNYLRVYAPQGSQLLESTQHDVPVNSLAAGVGWQGPAKQVQDVPGYNVFANYLLVPRGESVRTVFRYGLPQAISKGDEDQREYTLALYKQAGMGPEIVNVIVMLPGDGHYLDSSPAASSVEGTHISYEISLDADMVINLTYQP